MAIVAILTQTAPHKNVIVIMRPLKQAALLACIKDANWKSCSGSGTVQEMNPFDATKQDLCVGEWNGEQGLHGSRLNCTWRRAAI